MVVNTYNSVFRTSIAVIRKFHSAAFLQTTRPNSKRLKFQVLTQTRCVDHVSKVRCYCTVNRSQEVSEKYNEKYEERLNDLLKVPANLIKYQKLKLEIELLRNNSDRIPAVITSRDWFMLLSATSKSQTRGYLDLLWKNEKKDENLKLKKEQKKILREQQQLEPVDDNVYGLHKNTMFLRIYDTKIMKYYNSKLINAMLYEPTVIFDLEYETSMTQYETHNCAKQLLLSFALNRAHDDPFNLYFCNANLSGLLMEQIHCGIPTVYDEDFPLNITRKSYLDIFDKQKLVYLTPHAPNVLTKFNPNMIYIIGAMVDKVNPKPLSFAKAKREGIQMAQLPLANYLEWGGGSAKNLPLNQVLGILLDLRKTNDWKIALKHIPKRKLKDARQHMLMKTIQKRQRLIDLLTHKK